MPWQIVITDRKRLEFRFVKGQPFSTRYRSRLRHFWQDGVQSKPPHVNTFGFTLNLYFEACASSEIPHSALLVTRMDATRRNLT